MLIAGNQFRKAKGATASLGLQSAVCSPQSSLCSLQSATGVSVTVTRVNSALLCALKRWVQSTKSRLFDENCKFTNFTLIAEHESRTACSVGHAASRMEATSTPTLAYCCCFSCYCCCCGSCCLCCCCCSCCLNSFVASFCANPISIYRENTSEFYIKHVWYHNIGIHIVHMLIYICTYYIF